MNPLRLAPDSETVFLQALLQLVRRFSSLLRVSHRHPHSHPHPHPHTVSLSQALCAAQADLALATLKPLAVLLVFVSHRSPAASGGDEFGQFAEGISRRLLRHYGNPRRFFPSLNSFLLAVLSRRAGFRRNKENGYGLLPNIISGGALNLNYIEPSPSAAAVMNYITALASQYGNEYARTVLDRYASDLLRVLQQLSNIRYAYITTARDQGIPEATIQEQLAKFPIDAQVQVAQELGYLRYVLRRSLSDPRLLVKNSLNAAVASDSVNITENIEKLIGEYQNSVAPVTIQENDTMVYNQNANRSSREARRFPPKRTEFTHEGPGSGNPGRPDINTLFKDDAVFRDLLMGTEIDYLIEYFFYINVSSELKRITRALFPNSTDLRGYIFQLQMEQNGSYVQFLQDGQSKDMIENIKNTSVERYLKSVIDNFCSNKDCKTSEAYYNAIYETFIDIAGWQNFLQFLNTTLLVAKGQGGTGQNLYEHFTTRIDSFLNQLRDILLTGFQISSTKYDPLMVPDNYTLDQLNTVKQHYNGILGVNTHRDANRYNIFERALWGPLSANADPD